MTGEDAFGNRDMASETLTDLTDRYLMQDKLGWKLSGWATGFSGSSLIGWGKLQLGLRRRNLWHRLSGAVQTYSSAGGDQTDSGYA